MELPEIVDSLKSGFQEQLAKVEDAKIEITAKIAAVDEIPALVSAKEAAAEAKGFDAGLAQANQLGGEGKIYSDAELQAEIAPRDAKIAEQAAELEALKLEFDSFKQAAALAVDDAVAKLKAELKAKYEEQQVAESSGETGFAALLA